MPQVSSEGAKSPQSAWMSWLAIAAVAIVLGLLVPQMMPSEAAADKVQSKAESRLPTEPGSEKKLEYAAPPLPEAPSVQGMFVRLASGTAVVLGLCVATLWGIRRWLYPVAANASTSRELRLMETLQLGNRCALHLVHLNKQPILVGVDGGGIQTIVPLSAAFDDVLTEASVETPPVAGKPTVFPKLAA